VKRRWGVQVEGRAASFAWRVLEQAPPERHVTLLPMDGGRWYLAAASKHDAEHIRWCILAYGRAYTGRVIPAGLVQVITGAQALRQGLRPPRGALS
jgi:hypothetical protein